MLYVPRIKTPIILFCNLVHTTNRTGNKTFKYKSLRRSLVIPFNIKVSQTIILISVSNDLYWSSLTLVVNIGQ